ncbi:MAG: response regulator [Chloroflexi bacterium]|nr:response regulator [Chloroflexota bacterium]
MSNVQQVTILLVEDDPGHARLIEKNLRRSNITNEIVTVSDGQQALDYLFGEGEYTGNDRASPLLVLLDLNMPVLDGYQVLKLMKANRRTKLIPVVILTTTDDAREISRCYDLGAGIYITKPVEYQQFAEAISKLGLLLSIVTIPNGE